jgi:hypothetical protein
MEKYVERIDETTVVGSFLRAILSLQKEDYSHAQILINNTRYYCFLSVTHFVSD